MTSEVVVGTKSDNDWQAESDLNTLIEAEKIKKDSARLKRALVHKKALLKALGDVNKK